MVGSAPTQSKAASANFEFKNQLLEPVDSIAAELLTAAQDLAAGLAFGSLSPVAALEAEMSEHLGLRPRRGLRIPAPGRGDSEPIPDHAQRADLSIDVSVSAWRWTHE